MTIATECGRCGAGLPVAGRGRPARWCSTRCRMAAYRARPRVPAEMTGRDRWVRCAADKRPLQPGGRNASVTAPRTWCTYERAAAATVGTGVGFVLAGDGIVCVDLDHALVDGRVAPWAQAILDACPATFVEVSRSGTGLHVWGRGVVGTGVRIRDGVRCVEVYGSARYIALGTPRPGTPMTLADLTPVLATLTTSSAAAAPGR